MCYTVLDVESQEPFMLFETLSEHIGLNKLPEFRPDIYRFYDQEPKKSCLFRERACIDRPCLCHANVMWMIEHAKWERIGHMGGYTFGMYIIPPFEKSLVRFPR